MDFRRSVQHPVACVNTVTINTVYATVFILHPLLEDVLFYCDTFQFSFEPSSGNMLMISRTLSYPQRIRCFLGLINFL
jgi:hypothetical protein